MFDDLKAHYEVSLVSPCRIMRRLSRNPLKRLKPLASAIVGKLNSRFDRTKNCRRQQASAFLQEKPRTGADLTDHRRRSPGRRQRESFFRTRSKDPRPARLRNCRKENTSPIVRRWTIGVERGQLNLGRARIHIESFAMTTAHEIEVMFCEFSARPIAPASGAWPQDELGSIGKKQIGIGRT